MDKDTFAKHLTDRHGFKHVELIGMGGMGVVFRAWDEKLDRLVAVKLLSAELSRNDLSKERFHTEMKTLAKVNHSAVVRIHFGDIADDGSAYFVMDYVDGEDLGMKIRQRLEWGQRFSVAETVELLRPIAAALDYLHVKLSPPIIHRDVKAENILVPRDHHRYGTRSLLTDFGISFTDKDQRLTSLSTIMGTQKYLAPEILPGGVLGAGDSQHNQPGAATDNYALALVAFEMMTLQSYRNTMSEAQWMQPNRPAPNLSALGLNQLDYGDVQNIQMVFHRALHPAPENRPPSAVAFIQELSRTGSQLSTLVPAVPVHGEAEQATTIAPIESRTKRKGLVPVLIVAVVGLVALLIVLVWYALRHPAWSGSEAQMAQDFSTVISPRQNGTGQSGLVCASQPLGTGENARIECADEVLTLSFIDYESSEARNRAIPTPNLVTSSTTPNCTTSTGLLNDQEIFLPSGHLDRYALIVKSPSSMDVHLRLLTC